jgi:hypothetical protein
MEQEEEKMKNKVDAPPTLEFPFLFCYYVFYIHYIL